jgi:hypothetical protein
MLLCADNQQELAFYEVYTFSFPCFLSACMTLLAIIKGQWSY